MDLKAASQRALEKAHKKEQAIKLVEEEDIPVEKAFSKCGLQLSPTSYPQIKRKYLEKGLEGLIDTRGGKRHCKINDEILEFIRRAKGRDMSKSGAELVHLIKTEFGVTVDRRNVLNAVQKLGLSSPVGRRPKKPLIKSVPIDHAGCFFLKGALAEMGITNTIVDIIVRRCEDTKGDNRGGNQELIRLRIVSTSPGTIAKKIESLLLMPAFGMQRLWHFHTKYPRKGLGCLTGSGEPYMYHTMDNFFRELPKLDVAQELTASLAKLYIEVFNLEFLTLDEQTFYIDCHKKAVWTKKNIPKAKHTTRNKILKCLDVYFIHDHKGRPLLPMTRPGDSNFLDEMFELIDALEEAVEDKVVKISVFDREGLAVHVFRRFEDDRRRFITMLRENQYKGEEDFQVEEGAKWKPCKGARRILEAEKVLKDSKTGEEFEVRALLIRDDKTGKLAAAVTNIKPQEMSGDKIVEVYIDRWPKQENSFKQMKPGLYLDTNHGLKAKELKENRVAKRKAEKLEREIGAKEKKIKSAEKAVEKARQSLIRVNEVFESKIKTIKEEVTRVEEELALEPMQSRRSVLLNRLRRLQGRKDKEVEAHSKRTRRLEETISERDRYIKARARELESLRKKLKDMDLDEPLYEIDTKKDHLMTLFETALCNTDIWLKEKIIPGMERSDFATARNLIYEQSGFYRELKNVIDVKLNRYLEPEHQLLVEQACETFNKKRIRVNDKLLKISVLRSDPEFAI